MLNSQHLAPVYVTLFGIESVHMGLSEDKIMLNSGGSTSNMTGVLWNQRSRRNADLDTQMEAVM